jgi:CRP-like cAMP-binding protein
MGAGLGVETREAPLAALELLMFLHGMPLFAQLEPDDLETLAAASRERHFGPDESLCRQGERSDEVFLILRGRVRTWVLDAGGQPHSLGDSGEGTCIGEMAVLDPAPRAATVTALRDVLTLVLGGRVFRDVLHDRPAVAEGVLKVLTQRLRAMIQGTQSL